MVIGAGGLTQLRAHMELSYPQSLLKIGGSNRRKTGVPGSKHKYASML